ncbi:MAG: hypothetical protein DRO23_09805 [Thermoprotei archaeon]|nr:MAG: hypothetical protein DRO23_09805 [Thermoprotei archaeon]
MSVEAPEMSTFLYKLFSNVYYQQVIPSYDWNQISVTEAKQCLLKSFYQRKLGRKLFDPKIVVLSFGRLIHTALQDQLIEHGYYPEYETTFEFGNVTLYSHADALHPEHVLEIKTISRKPHQILTHHQPQINAYCIINKRKLGYVAYIHKPSGNIYSFKWKPQHKMWEWLLMRAIRLSEHLRKNVPPKPEPSWLCRYCEYIDLCPKPKVKK